MIKVKRLNGDEFVINCDLIEILEETPDTVITLTTGHKFVVRESIDIIIEKIKDFKRDINVKINKSRNEV